MSVAARLQPIPAVGQLPVIDSMLLDIADQPGELREQLTADFNARVQVGLRTYPTRLMSFNGRNALVDCYQEMLDAAFYLRQACLENPDDPDLDVNYWELLDLIVDMRRRLNTRSEVER